MIFSAEASALPRGPRFRFGGYRLEPDGTLFYQHKSIHLAAKELAALRLLLQNAGRIVTPQEMQHALWGQVHVTPDSVPRCISSLRARLEDDDCIQTVYKQGYRLTRAVERDVAVGGTYVPRLAIVPFSCGTNVAEHMGTAVAEDATARLTAAQPPIFSMLARDSAFALAARGKSAQEVGEALGADLVLTGTVNIVGMHYRVRMEMIRVQDRTQIWVEDLLMPMGRAAEMQVKLAERLAFRAGVSPTRVPVEDAAISMDAHAFNTFLRGRYEWQTMERHRMQDDIRYLQQAADLEPRLIQARVDMVRATVAQELFGYIAPSAAAADVQRIAASIEENEQASASILPAVGWMKFHVDRDLAAAETMLTSGDNQPDSGWNTRLRAMFAASLHRFGEATALLQEAIEADPYSPWLHAALAWMYHLNSEADQSAKQVKRCLELVPDHAATRLFGGMILAFNGEVDSAVTLTGELARKTPYFDLGTAAHAYALACKGDREHAEECLERLQWLSRERYVSRSFAAPAYLMLGDRDGAMAELRAADDDRCPWFFQILADPRLKELRAVPEFDAMRSRLEAMTDPELANPNPALH